MEPRAVKRRPKPYPHLNKPRWKARQEIRKQGHASKLELNQVPFGSDPFLLGCRVRRRGVSCPQQAVGDGCAGRLGDRRFRHGGQVV